MKEIRIEYFYEGQPYLLNRDRFNDDLVMSNTRSVQKRYQSFAERINAEDGYIEMHLSDSEMFRDDVYYEAFIKDISKGLQDDIERAIPSPWNIVS